MDELIAKTDLCVQCGLCLPYCPTYAKTQNENESPRGRLSLIQAWANKDLPASDKLQAHIDNCLLCRCCEKSCPALVPYGEIVDDFRSAMFKSKKKPALDLILLKNIAHNKTLNQAAQVLLKSYQATGFQKTVRFFKLPQLFKLHKIERLINNKPYSRQQLTVAPFYPATTKVKGDLFIQI